MTVGCKWVRNDGGLKYWPLTLLPSKRCFQTNRILSTIVYQLARLGNGETDQVILNSE